MWFCWLRVHFRRRTRSPPPKRSTHRPEYDQALEVLDRLSTGESSDDERQQIELYRTLCLLAVGRRAEADRAIESIITRAPLYQPGGDLPPRARTAFSDARKRLLPAIVQQQYAEARTAFDRSEFQFAAGAFRRVIDALDDPDMGVAGRQPPLADLRTLAAGFHDLSVKSIPPPPPPPPPAPVAEIAKPVAAPPRILPVRKSDCGSRSPFHRTCPHIRGSCAATGLKGIVEVVIDEAGRVQSVSMIMPVQASGSAESSGRSCPSRVRIRSRCSPPPAGGGMNRRP